MDDEDIVKIEKFGVADGSVFDSLTEAIRYNELLKSCDEIENTLPYRPEDTEFNNGAGWLQHEKDTKTVLADKIISIYNEYFGENATVLGYRVGRHIDDSGLKCLNHLVYRWQCMDIKDRELGQPYFVSNFEKVRGSRIN